MTFYFFTKGAKDVPSSRYRAYYIAEELDKLGHKTLVMPASKRYLKGFLTYLRILLKSKPEDVIYLQRTIYNKYFTIAIIVARLFGKRYIFDIDDAVYEHSRLKTKLFIKYADFVTCGSEQIRDWTLQHNERSYLLTNGIPIQIYTRRIEEPAGVPVIGWIGTFPEKYVQPIIPAFKKMIQEGKVFKIRIIGAMKNPEIRLLLNGMDNVEIIDSLDWSNPSEAVEEIKKFTIGIMPLTNSKWDQVKYFKVLEYMACGVPVVASPGKTAQAIIKEFNCGLVASNTEDWAEALTLLLEDADLRSEMGKAGRIATENSFTIKATAELLLSYDAGHRHSLPISLHTAK